MRTPPLRRPTAAAFAGLNANSAFYNLTLGLAMLIGRFFVIVPVLAVAGSLGAQQIAKNIENPSTRQFVRASSRPRFECNAIAVVSTAMISALLVTAAAAQQTQLQPQQAPTTATVPTSPELAPAIASWQQTVVARLARFQRYPAQAKGATGIVKLSFSIDRQGHVLNSQIIKSSGSAVLDAEALSLLTRAAPLPSPPAAVPDSDLTFVLPVRFGLR